MQLISGLRHLAGLVAAVAVAMPALAQAPAPPPTAEQPSAVQAAPSQVPGQKPASGRGGRQRGPVPAAKPSRAVQPTRKEPRPQPGQLEQQAALEQLKQRLEQKQQDQQPAPPPDQQQGQPQPGPQSVPQSGQQPGQPQPGQSQAGQPPAPQPGQPQAEQPAAPPKGTPAARAKKPGAPPTTPNGPAPPPNAAPESRKRAKAPVPATPPPPPAPVAPAVPAAAPQPPAAAQPAPNQPVPVPAASAPTEAPTQNRPQLPPSPELAVKPYAPGGAMTPAASAARSGELNPNTYFADWINGAPALWNAINSDNNVIAARQAGPKSGEAPVLELLPDNKGYAELNYRVSAKELRLLAGDTLLYEVELLGDSGVPMDVVMHLRAAGQKDPVVDLHLPYTGEGAWRTLKISVNVPVAELEFVDMAIRLRGAAHGGTASVRRASMLLIPQI